MLLAVVLTIVFILTCILLITIILLQPHHSDSGLAGAFGGGGGMDSFLGIKTVSVATKITVVLAVIFLLLSVVLGQLPKTSMKGGLISNTKPVAPEQPGAVTPTGTAPVSPTSSSTPGLPGQVQQGNVQQTPQTPGTPASTPGAQTTPQPVSPSGR